MTDVARQHAQVPVSLLWQREEQVGFRAAGAKRGDAAVRGLEELARVTERVPQRLVRLADILQMSGQAVDESCSAASSRCSTGNMFVPYVSLPSD